MITRGIIASLFLIFATVLTFSACDVTSEKGLDESLDTVPNVTLIKGAENASIRVNSGTASNFLIDIDNVEWNTLISNGEREAYCIAPEDPISSDNSIYDGIGVYSTENDEQFKDVNRLFSMKNALQKADPEITWREIQVAVWSLVPFQEFDMNMPVDELPSRVRSNGEPNFDKGKVQFILDAVQNRNTAKTAEFSDLINSSDGDSETTMCVLATDEQTQTTIVPCDETAFAYGDNYANCFLDFADVKPNRWGWSNGPLTARDDKYTFPLYAGAAGCDLTKGQITGTVEVEHEGSTVTVTFKTYDGYKFNIDSDGKPETHLYVGPNLEPGTNIAANGLFPNNNDYADGYSETYVKYVVEGNSEDIYIIAHAVMDGLEEPEDND